MLLISNEFRKLSATPRNMNATPPMKSSRARKVDTQPAADIVDSIVDELAPHKRPKNDVRELVCRSFEILQTEVRRSNASLAGTPAAALKHLIKVRKSAAELQGLLLTMPNRIAWVGELRAGTLGTEDEMGLLIPAPIERPREKFIGLVSESRATPNGSQNSRKILRPFATA